MSDDSPQKGWDGWFGAEPDAPGGEGSGPGQDVPDGAPDSASAAGSESESELTDWSMPPVREQAASPAQEQARPEVTEAQELEKRPAQSAQSAQTSPDGMATQIVTQPKADELDAAPTQVANLRSPDAAPAQGVGTENPDAAPTQIVTQPKADQPDAAPTQGVNPQSPDAAPTQVVNPHRPDAAPTQVMAQQTPDAQPTEVVPATPSPAENPPVSTDPWQPPQPAQMWGEAKPSAQPTAQSQRSYQAAGGAWQPQPQDQQPIHPQQAQAQAQQQTPPQTPRRQPHDYQPTAQHEYQAAQQHEYGPAAPQHDYEAAAQQHEYQLQQQSHQPYHLAQPQPLAYHSEPPQRPSSAFDDELVTNDRRPASRKKLFLASGIGAAAIVGLATVLVLNQGSLTGSGAGAAPPPSGFQPTGTSVTSDAEQTAQAFLSAWQSGNFKQAASYTDDPAAAESTLNEYRTGLNLNGLQLAATGATALSATTTSSASTSNSTASASASSAASYGSYAPTGTAGSVAFSVVAKVGVPSASTSTSSSSGSSTADSPSDSAASSSAASASGAASGSSSAVAGSVTADWSYSSKLVAYKKNGGWWIQWNPSLVAPNLTASEKVVSFGVAPSAAEVTDDAGTDLSSATDPGVHNIYAALKKAAPAGQGTPGVEVALERADGTQIPSSADLLSQPVNTGVVKTTINAKAEQAAQTAVSKYPNSSMVVLQPSTGHILAVANNDGDNDFALTARIAPGSTNKIITATALLTNGLVSSPSQAVQCPAKIVVDGTTFANSQNESEPAGTPFLTDFAVSCNNAFGQWYNKIGSTTLAQTAEKYYGLNEQWNLGTGPAGPYYQIPSSSSNGELFQELFGQGQLEAAPLAMASVVATVDSGSFKQPIVVQGASQLSATPLPANVQQDLWQMMKAVTTESDGTAYNVFSGVNSTVYGKTGTADVGSGQSKPNSWMVVFDPTLDVAIGCVVLDAGYGASYAAPEEAAVLSALQ